MGSLEGVRFSPYRGHGSRPYFRDVSTGWWDGKRVKRGVVTTSMLRRLRTRVIEYVQEPALPAGQIRRRVLFHVPLPILLLGPLALMVDGRWSAPGWTILLSVSVAVGALLLAYFAQPTPLPAGVSPETSVRRSLYRFRQISTVRIGLAMTPIVMGAAASITGDGLFPYVAALLLSWPQLLLALPGYFTVSRARRAMEAWGAKAYLWAALAQPARVEWPLITWWLDWRRARLAGKEAATSTGDTDRTGRTEKDDKETVEEDPAIPGVPPRLAPPRPHTPVEAVVPGFTSGSRSITAKSGPNSTQPLQLQLLRLRSNTRPKTRSRRDEQRQKAKN